MTVLKVVAIKAFKVTSKKLLNEKVFFNKFKIFINYLVDYQLHAENKMPRHFIFFKIFFFWKFYVILWNKLVKSAGLTNLSLRCNKKTRVFFMTVLIIKLSRPYEKKIKALNLDGYIKFFKRTHLIDLYLFWNLYYYHNILARFYRASFLAWAKFLVIVSNSFGGKNFLILKRFYGFSDLYKNKNYYIDLNTILIRFFNWPNLFSFENFIKKNSISFFDAQYDNLRKKLDPSSLIFDRFFPNLECVYVSKKKRYTPFFFTIHYEHNAKGFIGHNRRRFFKKKNMLLSI